MRYSINRLAGIMVATTVWMTVPALIFFYYFFVWLDDQTERETNRKLRALDELTREFIATRDTLPNLVRNEQRRVAANSGPRENSYWRKALSTEEERLTKLWGIQTQAVEALELELNAFEQQGGAGVDAQQDGLLLIDRLSKQYAESVGRMEKLHDRINELDIAKAEPTTVRLKKAGNWARPPPNDVAEDSALGASERVKAYAQATSPDHNILDAVNKLEKRLSNEQIILERYDYFWQSTRWLERSIIHPRMISRGKSKSSGLIVKLGQIQEAIQTIKTTCNRFMLQAIPGHEMDTKRVCFDASLKQQGEDSDSSSNDILTDADQARFALLSNQLKLISNFNSQMIALMPENAMKPFMERSSKDRGLFEKVNALFKNDNERELLINNLHDAIAARAENLTENAFNRTLSLQQSADEERNRHKKASAHAVEELLTDTRRTELVDRLYREGLNLKRLLEAEATWMETAGLAGERHNEYRKKLAQRNRARQNLDKTEQKLRNIRQEISPIKLLRKDINRCLAAKPEERNQDDFDDSKNERNQGTADALDTLESVKRALMCKLSEQKSKQDSSVTKQEEQSQECADAEGLIESPQRAPMQDTSNLSAEKNAQGKCDVKPEDIETAVENIRCLLDEAKSSGKNSIQTKKSAAPTDENACSTEENQVSIEAKFKTELEKLKSIEEDIRRQEAAINGTNKHLAFSQGSNSATYFKSLNINLFYDPTEEEGDIFDQLCQQDASRVRYELDTAGDGIVAKACIYLTAEIKYAELLGATSCEKGPLVNTCTWRKLSRASWSFSDIGHLFQTHLRTSGAGQGLRQSGEFEGVLLLDTNASLIRAFGDTTAAFADVNFLKAAQSPLLELAKSDTNLSEAAAEQEILRSQALSRASVWDLEIGATDYRLYIRPITETSTHTSKGDGLFGFIVGLEKKASFIASVKRIPIIIQAILALLVAVGLLLLPIIRLQYLKEADAISPVEALTVVISTLVLFSILTIAGLTMGYRMEFTEKTDAVAKDITQNINLQFHNELNKAAKMTHLVEKDIIAEVKKKDRAKYPQNKRENVGPKYYSIFADQTAVTVALDDNGDFCPGWLTESSVSNLTSSQPQNEQSLCSQHNGPYKLPEVREVFALNKDGELVGNLITSRRNVSANSSLRDRPYFQNAKNGTLWQIGDEKLFAQRIISRSSGEQVTVVSTRPSEDAYGSNLEIKPVAIAQSRIMQSVWHTVLLPGFEFAIIDINTGVTQYHAHDNRSQVENFYEEITDAEPLRTTMEARSSDMFALTYRGQNVRANAQPIEGTPWAVIVFYDTYMYDQIWMSDLSVASISMTLYIVVFSVLLLVLFAFFRNRKGFTYSKAFQRAFWPNENAKKAYMITVAGLLFIGTSFVLLRTFRPDSNVLWLLIGSGLLSLGWLRGMYGFAEHGDQLPETIKLATENMKSRIGSWGFPEQPGNSFADGFRRLRNKVTIPVWMQKFSRIILELKIVLWAADLFRKLLNYIGRWASSTLRKFLNYLNWPQWALISTTLIVSVIPAAIVLQELTDAQFERLGKYNALHILKQRVNRDNAVLEFARNESPWLHHYDASRKTALVSIDSFKTNKSGEHAYKGFNESSNICYENPQSGEDKATEPDDCKTAERTTSKTNPSANDETAPSIDGETSNPTFGDTPETGECLSAETTNKFGSWLLSCFSGLAQNDRFLRPFAANSAADCSWIVRPEKPEMTLGNYKFEFGKVEFASAGRLIHTHPVLTAFASLLTGFLVWLYFGRIVDHLFGHNSLNLPVTSKTGSLAEKVENGDRVIFISPIPLKTEDVTGNVEGNIVNKLLSLEDRRELLLRLEKQTVAEAGSVQVLDCRVNPLDFLNNPQHYPSLISLALARKTAIPQTATLVSEDIGTDVGESGHAEEYMETRPQYNISRAEAFRRLELNAHELSRWRSVLAEFKVHWVGQEEPLLAKLWKELGPSLKSEAVPDEKTEKFRSKKEKLADLIDTVSEHQAAFANIWHHCTFRQQLALYHMANGELLTRSARRTVCDLAQLGILESGLPYTIRGYHFATYIRNMVDFKETALQAVAENSSWRKLRVPILVSLGAVVILIVVAGGKNITESVQAIIGLLGASVALLIRFLPFGRG